MNKKGILIKLDENEAVMMTQDFKYYKIKGKSYMILGQEYEFKSSDIVLPKKKNVRIAAFAASIAASLVMILMIYSFFLKDPVYAYLDIDINPSIELAVNTKSQVVGTRAINDDAKKVLKDIDIKGKYLSDSIPLIIQNSIKNGYIKPDSVSYVLASASLKDGSKNQAALDRILKDCDKAIKQSSIRNMNARYIKVDSVCREQAVSNYISMGRYVLYLESKRKGNTLTIEEAKTKPLAEMMKGVENQSVNKNPVNSVAPKASPTNSPGTGSYTMVDVSEIPEYTPVPSIKNTPVIKAAVSSTDMKKINISTPKPLPSGTHGTSASSWTDMVNPGPTMEMRLPQASSTPEMTVTDAPPIIYHQATPEREKVKTPEPTYVSSPATPTPQVVQTTQKPVDSRYDLNGDGYINNDDLTMVYMAVKYQKYDPVCDLNKDKVVDDTDYYLMKNSIPPEPFVEFTKAPVDYRYDLNHDGNVNVKDLDVMNQAINDKRYDKACDLNGDGIVDISDYSILKQNI